jgi:putative redox protein
MELIAKYAGGVKFEVCVRDHRVICDQPVENGGADEGMSPPEFLLASLATCGGYYAAQYLKARGLSTEDLQVRVSAEKARQPARLASFQVQVSVSTIDERHEAGLLRAVKACLIHNTLLSPPEIKISVVASPIPTHS